jgi:hypothetical protein
VLAFLDVTPELAANSRVGRSDPSEALEIGQATLFRISLIHIVVNRLDTSVIGSTRMQSSGARSLLNFWIASAILMTLWSTSGATRATERDAGLADGRFGTIKEIS